LFYKGLKIEKMVQFSRNIYKTVLLCFFILIGINGCKKDYVSVIPYVPVYLEINLANKTELNYDGGFIYALGGYGGIIIFKDAVDSPNPFLAYDATCTHEISTSCRVLTDGSGVATCPCCGSQFILIMGGGNPVKGPAIEPLKQYRTTFAGGRIIIRN
jgi:Rieske Fe-S protein